MISIDESQRYRLYVLQNVKMNLPNESNPPSEDPGIRRADAASASSEPQGLAAVLGQLGRPVPPKLYRIGELVEFSGVSRQTIHNYATMGLLRETRWTKGGHRLFDEQAFGRLAAIEELKAQKKSLQFIRQYFDRLEAGQAPDTTT